MTMTHASLFSGIGGFDLAAEWAGWTNSFNCEIDPLCRRILKHHFPNAEQYGDIHTTDFTIWRGRVDVLTGGFPCQPFSLAGKRKGTEDDRYLWPEMLRVIRTVRPRWVVGENVFGIVNWSEGVVFQQVCSDLEAAGYAVQPYIIPACGVGAPHRRDRCWFVAHRTDTGVETMQERQDGVPAAGNASDTDCERCQEFHSSAQPSQTQERITQNSHAKRRIPDWNEFPTQSPVCCRNDGISGGLDGITFPKWRNMSIKAYGNAIVPQVALQIFKTINEYENQARKH
jgi:DNA (cytosine-5)-methyltransferase 1